MKSGIYFTNKTLKYVAFPKRPLPSWHCVSFEIELKDIKVLALSPRMNFDDDLTFLLIVSKNHTVFSIPLHGVIESGIQELENYFEINSLVEEKLKFKDEEYDSGIVDKIIFPKSHYWQDLFHKDWKLKIRWIYGKFWSKAFYGNLKIDTVK
ncbi:hypothetical protein [Maribacter zhoushanensis]|uniref:hypothetical protein n=1 Tax=Maribacter zhoushanensis TaxID=3030012 RepID=UPI0023ED6B3D|nr:hypothetical protein [Maribacter zhoushanensis]